MLSKNTFYLIWAFLIVLPFYTVLKVTNLELAFEKTSFVVHFLQRITGLLAFSLLFFQLVVGSFMQQLTDKLGGWVFKFHITHAIFLYILIFSHPVLFVVFNWVVGQGFDPFYVFTDFCLLCRNSVEMGYSLGRFAFVAITIAYIAAKFREHPLLQRNWRKFHILNYVAFILVSAHAWRVGSDIRSPYFFWFFVLTQLGVLYLILRRVFNLSKSNPKFQKLLFSESKK